MTFPSMFDSWAFTVLHQVIIINLTVASICSSVVQRRSFHTMAERNVRRRITPDGPFRNDDEELRRFEEECRRDLDAIANVIHEMATRNERHLQNLEDRITRERTRIINVRNELMNFQDRQSALMGSDVPAVELVDIRRGIADSQSLVRRAQESIANLRDEQTMVIVFQRRFLELRAGQRAGAESEEEPEEALEAPDPKSCPCCRRAPVTARGFAVEEQILGDKETCAVCMRPYDFNFGPMHPIALNCNHAFCKNCLSTWFGDSMAVGQVIDVTESGMRGYHS